MNEGLKISLSVARSVRDWGNFILAVGILLEIAIDALWVEKPPAYPVLHKKRTMLLERSHFPICTLKGFCVVLAGFVVLGGLWMERTWGKQADDIADTIRANLQTRIIEISPRTQLLTPAVVSAFLARLQPFARQKVEVRFCRSYPTDSEPVILATRFMAQIFGPAKWTTIGPTPENCMGTGISVEISRRAPQLTRDAANALYAVLKGFQFDPGDMVFTPPTIQQADDVVIFRVTSHPL